MHTELALIVLAATILVVRTQLQWPRPAPIRQSPRRSRRAEEEPRQPRAGRGLAGQVAWLGMAGATLACLGHLALPVADPFWLALIAAATASVPAAFVAPSLQTHWRQRRAQAEQEREQGKRGAPE